MLFVFVGYDDALCPIYYIILLIFQGFRTAEKLASKVVPFFKLCDEQLSSQSHYDFGLRALKNVLISAGNVKRDRTHMIMKSKNERGEEIEEENIAKNINEQEILIAVSKLLPYGLELIRNHFSST